MYAPPKNLENLPALRQILVQSAIWSKCQFKNECTVIIVMWHVKVLEVSWDPALKALLFPTMVFTCT